MNTFRETRIYIPGPVFLEGDKVFTEVQQDLVVGTMLGDANMQTFSSGKTWRYRAVQKQAHEQLLDHKYEILKDFCESPPMNAELFDQRTVKRYYRRFFNTVTFDCFTPFALAFYLYDPVKNKWIKDIPSNIEELLTPRAVAYWYMDDGALKWKGHSNAMRICTESYSKQGIEILQKAMQKKFSISLKTTKKALKDGTVGYRLGIDEKNSSVFRELIRPYLVDCMKYKVSDGNNWHL